MPQSPTKRGSSDTPLPQITPDRGFESARRRALLKWYRAAHRAMPWREPPGSGRHPDPYAVLVSEQMLQQTQVATVIPYFHRWMRRFPDVHALADADEQDVLTLWQGLGYYNRARNLRKAARVVVDEHGGEIPGTVNALRQLPGVGPYTAGAVASIAFGVPTPLVDGNVMRVLTRWFGIDRDITATPTKNKLWELAGELVPKDQPGDFNQALMELGATVCLPRNPACLTCPVRGKCVAVERGLTDRLPVKPKKKDPKAVTHTVVAVRRGGKYLFEQRPARGMWANLWQLPTREEKLSPAKQIDWVAQRFGLHIARPRRVQSFQHRTTHRLITFGLFVADCEAGRLKVKTGDWHRPDGLDTTPLANPQRKAVELLAER